MIELNNTHVLLLVIVHAYMAWRDSPEHKYVGYKVIASLGIGLLHFILGLMLISLFYKEPIALVF